MNPNNFEQVGLTLPAPTPEKVPKLPGEADLANPEQIKPAPPSLSQPATPLVAPAPVFIPSTPLTAAPAGLSTTPTSTSGNPTVADDSDLIEKEWVSKAKQIVDQTKEDPYKQTKEIGRFKADYIKRRYNKEVKVNDE